MVFWEPHTSSIDFCESNYLLSNYIVEVHNTWSSILGLSFFGLLGLVFNNHTREVRHAIAYSILILIGLGSAGLHGTLHWFLQSSDELPMMYLLLSVIYLCAEWDAPLSSNNTSTTSNSSSSSSSKSTRNYPNLPTMLSLVAVTNTIIYYCLQKIYFVFLFTFISETTLVATWLYLVVYNHRHYDGRRNNPKTKGIRTSNSTSTSSHVARKICNTGIGSIILAAVPCWLFDMLHCQYVMEISNQYFLGVTPHVVWHFGAGFGAYCVILSLECCRLDELQIPYVATFQGGFFPRITTRTENEVLLVSTEPVNDHRHEKHHGAGSRT